MNVSEAEQVASEYLSIQGGFTPELGFEVVDRTQFDYAEWEIRCNVFSNILSMMVECMVVIHDNMAISARRV